MTNYHVNISGDGFSSILVAEGARSALFTSSKDPVVFAQVLEAVERQATLDEVLSINTGNGYEEILKLSGRVGLQGNQLVFDNQPVNGHLADTIVRYHNEGRPYNGLIRLMERLADNTSEASKDHLFAWVESAGLKITEDGFVIGYKAVQDDALSIHAGEAFVNGEHVEGHIPNKVGSVITMPRDKVDANPNSACSYGLHVGTLDYARTFGPRVLVVIVDPKDVVAVPSHETAKMRTCQYTVLAEWDSSTEHEPQGVSRSDVALDAVSDVVPSAFLQRLRERLTWAKS